MLTRPRPRHLRPGIAPEPLEVRRLLASGTLAVAPTPSFASGLPLPGLAVGAGLTPATATTSAPVTVAPVTTGAAPAVTTTPPVPSPTGPAPTLSPLMNDAETANAAASEVARPTPGRSNQIPVTIPAPEPAPRVQAPETSPVIPGPEVQAPAPANPAPAPAQAAPPPVTPTPAPSPVPAVPAEPAEAPLLSRAWDAALGFLATGAPAEAESAPEATLPAPAEATLAAGALLAAWVGHHHGPRVLGRSCRRARTFAPLATAPGAGGPR